MTERLASDELTGLTATELASAYRRGELSPLEATRAVLEQISHRDNTVNAYCVLDPDFALEEAAASEKRWLAREPLGPIDGVPTSVKDILLTKGWPTRRGSLSVNPDQEWIEDAPAVARLRESGAVIVGKTTTPELAWKGVTDSPLTGITRNPWNTDRTSGGSSGGAAAAVAAGMGPLALGTDGGGSVRIPGSFCGVVGFKATYGAVPLYPPSPFGTLAHVGPVTRTVADTAVLMDAVTGRDSRDWSALAPPAESFAARLATALPGSGDTPLSGLRVAYSRDLGFVSSLDPEVGRAVDEAVGVLADLGARIEGVDPGFTDPVWAFECLWFSGAAKATEHLTDAQRAELDPGLADICEQGRAFSAQDYLEAMAQRMNLGVKMGAFHERYDLLVTPTMPITAFEAGIESPADGRWTRGRWTEWTPYTYPFNLTQQPAISVPCGFTAEGLPVGLQVIGARHDDARVLAAAAAFENATDWWRRRPS
ncbi:amidase [Rhodococcus triatomae]|uniref:amidase n=1 Tax=Rhodococcus triatomae TaxID=300028 RepID=A0A1G8M3V1_9NOCA|nr:amidase [Rhodococcus triatomae]QNG18212.1 amidase [Rhodococcus triatomae]QNG22117.1 amidase [Rhodococcus triatomae]SDI62050.1 aspartyl-tRNA(Asn)/glutamyl-tRNA(Gln) amidotransferase subunit A [Rhodococcus triatomae]